MLALAFSALLSACGGGSSGSGEPPPAPTGPPGTLDATFGTGGIVVTTASGPAAANALILQPDGKIVVAGTVGDDAAKSFFLARYNVDGTLDLGFGSAGTVSTVFDHAAGSEAHAIALQPDGRIVVAGSSAGACALARYNPDGTLDAGFGTGGTVLSRAAHDDVVCAGVALQTDGKIVTAVDHGPLGYEGIGRTASVMRFNAEGGRDPSFGTGGEAIVGCGYDTHGGLYNGFGCRVASVLLRPEGGLLISGAYWTSAPFGGSYMLMVGQLMPDGSPDLRFAGGGYWTRGSFCTAGSVALQPDGAIVVTAGEETSPGWAPNGCGLVARVLADGNIDSGFGSGGFAFGGSAAAVAVALQANGKIVVAGHFESRAGDGTTSPPAIAVLRYRPAGDLDAGFGSSGIVTTPLGTSAKGSAVAVLPDGRIVVAGTTTLSTSPSSRAIFVARYFGDPP